MANGKIRTERFGDTGVGFITIDDGICNSCIYVNDNGYTCTAFPDGIPKEILTGKVKHFNEYDGDNGIQFKAREE